MQNLGLKIFHSAGIQEEKSVFELPGSGGRVEPPNCFLNPSNTLSNYVLGVSYILYTYNLHHNFVRAPTIEKFNPPTNFSQFKHWEKWRPHVGNWSLFVGNFFYSYLLFVQAFNLWSRCDVKTVLELVWTGKKKAIMKKTCLVYYSQLFSGSVK